MNNVDIYKKILSIKSKKGFVKFALIDPEAKNDDILDKILDGINHSDSDMLLVGGSMVETEGYDDRVLKIKKSTNIPLLLFPGSSNQITPHIKNMLYLNLISGRNPKYLIEEHVAGSMKVNYYNIKTIPTAYILLDGGKYTSVQKFSNTKPLNMNNKDLILKHALAGEYMGNKIIYFDCGSGAKDKMDVNLIRYISKYISIPIMVGGGLLSDDSINEVVSAGASFVVCGTMFENKAVESAAVYNPYN